MSEQYHDEDALGEGEEHIGNVGEERGLTLRNAASEPQAPP